MDSAGDVECFVARDGREVEASVLKYAELICPRWFESNSLAIIHDS